MTPTRNMSSPTFYSRPCKVKWDKSFNKQFSLSNKNNVTAGTMGPLAARQRSAARHSRTLSPRGCCQAPTHARVPSDIRNRRYAIFYELNLPMKLLISVFASNLRYFAINPCIIVLIKTWISYTSASSELEILFHLELSLIYHVKDVNISRYPRGSRIFQFS